jgi:hypothetical protein
MEDAVAMGAQKTSQKREELGKAEIFLQIPRKRLDILCKNQRQKWEKSDNYIIRHHQNSARGTR